MKTVTSHLAVTPAKSKGVIGALLRSKIFADYKRAFKELTGLKITLHSVEAWPLPRTPDGNPLCGLFKTKNCSCVCCRRAEQRMATNAPAGRPVTAHGQCHCGAAIPLWLGRQLVGIVQMAATVQEQSRLPSAASTKGEERRPQAITRARVTRKASAELPPLTPSQHAAASKLLGTFAKHLAIVSNQIVVQTGHIETPLITRAKAYIAANCATNLSLTQTARAMNLSTSYFCKLFQKSSGIKYSEYLSRVRLERAKGLLLNRDMRISEVAYEVGFQSLTHFNRTFKNLVGVSPKEFRRQSVAA